MRFELTFGRFIGLIFLLGVSGILGQVYIYSQVKDLDLRVVAMVDRTSGQSIGEGKGGTYYWAVIEGNMRASTSGYYKFTVAYHLCGCDHLIDFTLDSVTKIGDEYVKIDYPTKSIEILRDNLTEFDTQYSVADKLITKFNLGARMHW